MNRIGVIGGTFDPPHRAHLEMARTTIDRLPIETVLFMPAPRPPHKSTDAMTPFELRVKMVELAIAGQEGFELSRMESEGEGASYTVDLLRRLARQYDDIYMIIGADSLQDLPTWKEPESILELATLDVFARTGHPLQLPVGGPASLIVFEEPVIDVSSTELRATFRSGRGADDVPVAVRQFILDNSLYS